MSIQSEINRITANIGSAYTALAEKNATVPAQQNSENLAAAILSIPSSADTSGSTVVEPALDDIPKVFFGNELPQTKDETVMSFRYISKTEDIAGYCKTKAQGSSSMNYPKKNQTVKLYKNAQCSEKMKINFKDWGEQNKFCFKANWIDLTHARNIVNARLWGDIVKSRTNYAEIPELLRTSPNQGAVDGFPVKVYADGVYQGRYTINIPKDAWMANMDDELDTHCILCGESNADDRSLFRTAASIDGYDWSDELHDTVPGTIKARWNEAISFIVNSTDDEFIAGIGDYFDIDSLIDYYLFGLASCGLDAFGKNQLFMTYDGRKWFATMYDMDSTWGLWWDGSKFVESTFARSQYQDYVEGSGNLLFIRIAKLFANECLQRWESMRKDSLSVANIVNRFERFVDVCSPYLVEEDFANTTVDGAFSGIPSQSTNNIQQIRNYITARLKYCDGYMSSTEVVHSYTICDYIEADGTQYIDTGISGGANAAYEIKFSSCGSVASDWNHYFAGDGKDTSAARIQAIGSAHVIGYWANSSHYYWLWNMADAEAHIVRYDSTGAMYVDDVAANYGADTSGFAGNGWGDLSWYVFNSHNEPTTKAKMRLYYLKMYTDGVLVRDFIPVYRNSDGVFGLWDRVSETFFENIGTGSFVGGYSSDNDDDTNLIDYTLDPLADVTWHDDSVYAWDTGMVQTTTGEHRTDKFKLQDCVYEFNFTEGGAYGALFVWDENDVFVGRIERGWDNMCFTAKSEYSYAIKVYKASDFDASMISFMPKNNRDTMATSASITLADLEWTAADGYVEASTTKFCGTGGTTNVVNNANAVFVLRDDAHSSWTVGANNTKFVGSLVVYDGTTYIRTTMFTDVDSAMAYFTANKAKIVFNK